MNPCDKKSDYNCYNHYIDLGFDDERGCLEEYKCDEPTVTECPDSISEYREFKLESCGRKGWSQNNSDCWLDSALYLYSAQPTYLRKQVAHLTKSTPKSRRSDWPCGTT
jgi:hypothetical protein